MPAAKAAEKGDALMCQTCGLVVVVDEVCGCVEEHEIVCCSVPMKPVGARTATRKAAAKAKAKAAPRTKAKLRK